MADLNQPLYRFACPGCGRVLKAPLSWSGRRGICPNCQNPLYFPKRTSLFKADKEGARILLKLVADDLPMPGEDLLDRLALLLAQGTCLEFSAAKMMLAPGPLPAKAWRKLLPKAGAHESLRLQLDEQVHGSGSGIQVEGAMDLDSLAFPSKDAASEDALAWEIIVRLQDYLRHGTCDGCKKNPTGLSCIYRTFEEFADQRELESEEVRRWAKLCRQVFGLMERSESPSKIVIVD